MHLFLSQKLVSNFNLQSLKFSKLSFYFRLENCLSCINTKFAGQKLFSIFWYSNDFPIQNFQTRNPSQSQKSQTLPPSAPSLVNYAHLSSYSTLISLINVTSGLPILENSTLHETKIHPARLLISLQNFQYSYRT